jgi:hypothetical protein
VSPWLIPSNLQVINGALAQVMTDLGIADAGVFEKWLDEERV